MALLKRGFRRCYQRVLEYMPEAQGKISMEILVDEQGAVERVGASLSGNLPRETVRCVIAIVRHAKFEAPEGGRALLQVPVQLVAQLPSEWR